MQVLACAPAQVRDSFSNYEGESPRGLDTELYGEANEKDSWGRRSLWPTRRFRVNSREVALPETSKIHFTGNGVMASTRHWVSPVSERRC